LKKQLKNRVRYRRALPFVRGNIMCLTPVSCWTEESKRDVRFCLKRHVRTWFGWRLTRVVSVRYTKLRSLMAKGLVS
jgi:hypothetical protein